MALDAARELDADERIAFVSDMSVVVGSIFSKENPVEEHMELLTDIAAGVKKHGEAAE